MRDRVIWVSILCLLVTMQSMRLLWTIENMQLDINANQGELLQPPNADATTRLKLKHQPTDRIKKRHSRRHKKNRLSLFKSVQTEVPTIQYEPGYPRQNIVK